MMEKQEVLNRKVVTWLSVLLACLSMCFVREAACATYYVSPSGSNSNPGTSSAPFLTINNAARIVNPGDTVIVMDGTYYENYDGTFGLNIGRGGTSSAPVIFQAQNAGRAIIDGNNARSYGIQITPVSYVRVRGFEIRNFRLMGMVINGNYNTIEYNIIHHNGGLSQASGGGQNGIYVHSANTSNITIHGNTIYQNGRLSLAYNNIDGNKDHGVYLCSPNSTISYNLIYRNQAYGIQISGEVPLGTTRIVNNTITLEQNRGGIVLWQSGARGCVIENNIIASNGPSADGFGIEFDGDGGGHIIRNNNLYNNPTGNIESGSSYTASYNINTNPLFVSPSTSDFRLQSGSPAINTGLISTYQGVRSVMSYDGIPITDSSGNLLVSNINMGAFAASGGGAPPPAGGTTCTYTISPGSQSFTAQGGIGTVSVTTQTGCAWTAVSGASWMSITSGASGTGNGTVGYSVAANTTTAPRTSASTIAGRTFTVTQAASSSTTQQYTITATAGTGGRISPSGAVLVNAGSSQSFTITTQRRWRVSDVVVDGASLGPLNTYTFSNVTANHTISVRFRRRY